MNIADRALRIAAFLDSHRVMSLATCGPCGPHAANVFYARDDLCLLWVSGPDSEHAMHLRERAPVAATIAADCRDYADIKGLQIDGEAWRIVEPDERRRAQSRLEARFAFLRQIGSGPVALREAYARAEFYRLQPKRIVFIDNTRGFGFKEAIEFEGGRAALSH